MNPIIVNVDPAALADVQTIIEKASRQGTPITPDEVQPLLKNEKYGKALTAFYDSFRFAGIDENNGKWKMRDAVIPALVAEYIRARYPFVIIDNLFYIYDNGYYKRDTNYSANMTLIINNLIRPEYQSRNRAAEVLAQLKTPDHIKAIEQMNTHPVHYICFKNGVYDPVTQKMLPHSPDYLFTNQIPWDYDPAATPPGDIIEAFFEHAEISGDNYIMLCTFIGLCLTTDTRLQKMLILKGPEGTGKSKFLGLIKDIVGAENCSAESLEALNENRFRAYNVLGKLANINADLTTEGTIDPAIIKQIVGEDTLAVERKGVQGIEITPFVKCIFSMNNFPLIRARDNSFYRRVMLLPVEMIPEKIDQGIAEKLRTQADYLLHAAVACLEAYYDRPTDERNIESADSKRLVEMWKQKGDSVSAFLAEAEPFREKPEVLRKDLFEAYKEYCSDEHRQPLGKSNFNDSLIAKRYRAKKVHGEWYIEAPKDKQPGFLDAKETPFQT